MFSPVDKVSVAYLNVQLCCCFLAQSTGICYFCINQQDNNVVRKRTVPVWKCLINNLLEPQSTLPEKALMEKVIAMSRNNPSQYMISWRKSLQMSNHWNFWARAYSDS